MLVSRLNAGLPTTSGHQLRHAVGMLSMRHHAVPRFSTSCSKQAALKLGAVYAYSNLSSGTESESQVLIAHHHRQYLDDRYTMLICARHASRCIIIEYYTQFHLVSAIWIYGEK